jgi:hypothetical protein
MTEKIWIRTSLRHLKDDLDSNGHSACVETLRRLLRKAKYSLKANCKREAGADHPDRNTQFEYLDHQKHAFLAAGLPIISVDTKKKELIGNFKNNGRSWCLEPERVNVHDFAEDDQIRAAPYGIYNVNHNRGFVCVGNSADTPEFAVTAICAWWEQDGRPLFPEAKDILILADTGGSNGCHPRAWKLQLQQQLADRLGLTVTVCHYPAHCSKWNPVERRLFSPISINWAARPLRTLQTMLECIRGTTTRKGLTVKAFLLDRTFETGKTATDAEMSQLRLRQHSVCPRWNYTIEPRLAEV